MTRPRVTITVPPSVAAKVSVLARYLGVPPSSIIRAIVEKYVDKTLERYGVSVKDSELREVMKRLRWERYLSKYVAEKATDPIFGE